MIFVDLKGRWQGLEKNKTVEKNLYAPVALRIKPNRRSKVIPYLNTYVQT